MLGGVDGHHLNGGDGRQTLLNGMPQHAVHVPFIGERARMRVVGDEHETARIQTVLGDGTHLRFHVVPGRTITQHGLHALPHAFDGVFKLRAFVVILRAARHIPVERQTQIG